MEMVSVEFVPEAPGTTELGENAQVIPAGNPAQPNDVDELNPLIEVRVAAVVPWLLLAEDGSDTVTKVVSTAIGTSLMFMVNFDLCDCLLLVAVICRVQGA